MSIRHLRKLRRAGAVTLVSAALVVSVTSCGNGDDSDDSKRAASTSSSAGQGQSDGDGQDQPSQDDTESSGTTVKGDDGIEMVIQSAKRDSGGFVTVNGQFNNPGGETFTIPVQWSGAENAVAGTGRSIAAMTLVDSKDKKRYYVLRDTENRPLTTAAFDPSIKAGGSLSFFAQFPAPPQSTTSVDLQFPGFPDTAIEIS
ncbi:hypothetical protein [Streptomyces sp. NPDC050560]|uniref:hypothetical protein n=1 Tax=Streptomyces sp. NPDC050560 TaxID=3365630 RepID=UPI0037ABB319